MLTLCIFLYFKGRVEVLVQWHPCSGWYVSYSKLTIVYFCFFKYISLASLPVIDS